MSIVIFLTKGFSQSAVENKLKYIKNNAEYVEIANINCNIDCGGNVVICDTIAVNGKGQDSKTVELPFSMLSDSDGKYVVDALCDSEIYLPSKIRKGVFYSEVELNCFSAPTVALLFFDKDSIIISQLLIDFKCMHYNLYWLEGGCFKIVEYDNKEIDIPFYSKQNAAFLKIAHKYKMNCSDN